MSVDQSFAWLTPNIPIEGRVLQWTESDPSYITMHPEILQYATISCFPVGFN